MILENTPFYAESGGQIGDSGYLNGQGFSFEVKDTQKYGQVFGHIGELVSGSLTVGKSVNAVVDVKRRHNTSLNHSATHLLHAALRQVLGEHVVQKGSLVSDVALRFDFAHHEAITKAQLVEIECLVNQQIRANHLIQTELMELEAAKAKGAMALFGEKYADQVRVLTMGDFSIELCGEFMRSVPVILVCAKLQRKRRLLLVSVVLKPLPVKMRFLGCINNKRF